MRTPGDRPSWPTSHRPAGLWPAAALLFSCAGALRAAQVLLVVGNTTLNSGDTAIYNRLANQSHTVTVVDDGLSVSGDAAGKSLVLISSTCLSSSVNLKFRDVAVPVVVWESALLDDMRMTGSTSNTDFGSQSGQTQLAVQAAGPLSAGLAGTLTVTTGSQTYTWGVPNPATASVSARLAGNPAVAAVFSYQTGQAMVGQSAPAPRVGFFLEDSTASALNSNGWALFDAAVHWSVNQQPAGAGDLPDRLEPIGPSSRRTGLVFSEIMYNPAARVDNLDTEFVEIHNAEPFTRDIGGYRLEGEIEYTFPPGTTLAPRAYLVVARTPADLQAVAGITGVLGPYTGSLGNGGGDLRLLHRQGAVLLDLRYDDERPWPKAADGAGPSLTLAAPSHGEASARAWAPSARVGGTPGVAETWSANPHEGLEINEILANAESPDVDFLELYNHSGETRDLSGLQIANNPASNRYVVVEGTLLEPGQSIHFNEFQLGFDFSSTGGAAFVFNLDGSRVIDAQEFDATDAGVSLGRFPDGGADFHELSLPTPGGENLGLNIRPVVINEIMYHPLSQDRDDEYVELHNDGSQSVAMDGWRLRDAVDYLFPAGTALPPNGFLVVARNRARFLTRYPAVNPALVHGDFSGSLADSGERLLLEKPSGDAFVRVDEVTYDDGGTWGDWSDGGGSSLELVDPKSDNRHGANWADSDESAKAPWTAVSVTGVLDNGTGTPNELQILNLEAAEIAVDKIVVRKSTDGGSVNRVANGDFESNLTGWVIQGNHEGSFRDTTQGAGGSASSLRLVSPGDGDNGANRAEIDLTTALASGDTATITAQARWLRGHTNLLFRLKGNYLEAVGNLAVPTHLGTPGAVNSRRVANAGPVIADVTHRPLLPTALSEITITTRVLDVDPLLAVNLKYRVDPSATLVTVAMTDNGAGSDEVAGDGIYSAKIPGQSSGVTVAYVIEASDYQAASVTTLYPRGAPAREALVRWGEPAVTGDFAAYRFWMTAANLTLWETRQKLSNTLIPGTFIYNDSRVVHGAGARYRGSPWIRPNYSSPLSGQLANLVFNVPSDDRVVGATAFNVDAMEQDIRDGSLQREKMAFWLAEQMGAPFIHQRFFTMVINGVKRGQVYQDSQQPNGDYLECWFPGQDGGDFFEVDDWFEFNDNATVGREFNADASLSLYTTTGGEKKRARYRWSWQKKSVDVGGDNAAALFGLVDTMNLADNAAFLQAVRAQVDLTSWFRDFTVRRVLGDWDGYGFNRGKNTFLYRPEGGKWSLLLWDLDFTTGAGSRNYDQPLFDQIQDPVLGRFYTLDPLERIYWAMLKKAVEGPMVSTAFNPVSDELHSVFLANGLSPTAPSTAQTWVANRRTYILGQLANVNATFAIGTNGGANFSTGSNPVTLTGTAPIEAAQITVNGSPVEATWTALTGWSVSLYLQPGVNTLVFSGNDLDGNPLPALTDTITVTLTGGGVPLLGNLVLTEIQYHPPDQPPYGDTDLEFIELKNIGTQVINLGGASFSSGITHVFPANTLLAPGAFLVLASSSTVFNAVYPWVPLAGDYGGQLSNSGETLTLIDGVGTVVSSVPFDDTAPWPTIADGAGPSLVPVLPNPAVPQNAAADWRASAWPGGSPGMDDPALVAGPPVILTHPTNQVAPVGTSALFYCLATGYPQPAYQWRRNGTDVDGATSPYLMLASVSPADHGAQFDCVLQNGVGSPVVSQAGLLIVPSVESHPRETDCLVAYYPFNERSGTSTADRSGFGSALNLGFTGGGITWFAGQNGVKISSNSSILSSVAATKVHTALQSSRQFTLELWAKPANTTQTGPARMMGASVDTVNRNYGLVQSAANLDFRLRTTSTGNNGSSPATTASGVMTTAQPTHYVATFTEGGPTQVYINGVPTASITPGGTIGNWNSNYKFILANEITGDRPWLGEIYLAAVYNCALSAAQIQENLAAGSQPNPGAGVPPVITSTPTAQTIGCRTLLPAPATNAVAVTWNCSSTGVVVATDLDLGGGGCSADPGLIRRVFTAIDQCGLTTTSTQLFTVVDSTAPVLVCPPTQTVNIIGGACSAAAPDLRGLATVSDGCDAGPFTVTQSPAPGTVLAGGNRTITLSTTDRCGNTGSCQFTLYVRDVTPPGIVCPTIPIVRSINAACQASVPRVTPVVSDNCTASAQIVVTQVPAIGTTVGAGTHSILVTATDAAGNQNQCTATLQVNDVVAPTITCPGSVTLDAVANCQVALPAFSAASTSDSCGAVTVTQSPAAGTLVGLGNTTVTLTARDGGGNTAQCALVVTVRDVIAPVMTCPASLVLDANATCQLALPVLSPATLSDNCGPGAVTVTQSPAAGTVVGLGPVAVTLTARDAAGNPSQCSFTLTVRDGTPPVMTCPGPLTLNANASCKAVLPYLATGSPTDNCGSGSVFVLQTPLAGTLLAVGAHDVNLVAQDEAGNQSTCVVVVTVRDAVAPVITCPGAVTLNANAACRASLPALAPSTLADTCGVGLVTVTQSPPAGTLVAPGVHTVTLTATDGGGNTAACAVSVTVRDVTAPTILCPPDMILEAVANCGAPAPALVPTVSDACSESQTLVIAQNPASGTPLPVGTNYVALAVSDAAGNTNACLVTVVVLDRTAPVLVCPPDLTLLAEADGLAALPAVGPTSWFDACPTPGLPLFVQSPPAGTRVADGSEITLSLTDLHGNSGECRFPVIVLDRLAPVVECPTNLVIDAVLCSAPAPTLPTNATDNVTAPEDLVWTQVPAPGTPLPVGSSELTQTVVDLAGNVSTCLVQVLVREAEPPVFTSCPVNQTVDCFSAVPVPVPGDVTVTDTCDPAPVITVLQTDLGGSGTPANPRVLLHTYTATDASGNASTCERRIEVLDDEKPVLLGILPAQVLQCEAMMPPPVAPPFADNCDGNLTITFQRIQQFSAFGCSKMILYSWTAIDDAGNRQRANQRFLVRDSLRPTILSCPPGGSVASLDAVPPPDLASFSAVDNCDSSLALTLSTNLVDLAGCQARVDYLYTVVDDCGNARSCTESWVADLTGDPVIHTQPVDQSAAEGGTATFTAGAVGCSELSYQWMRDGLVLPGATSASVTVTDLTAPDTGSQFRCLVLSPEGNTVSALATLTILPAGSNALPVTITIEGDGTPEGALISFPSEVGIVYRLQKAIDLAQPEWINCGPSYLGDGAVMSIPEPGMGEVIRYYRVVGWPPAP